MDHLKRKQEHESFLAKKKAEILAKKNSKTNIPSPSSSTDKSTNKQTPQTLFANDGSFLEKFLAMQKSQQPKQPGQTETSGSKKISSFIVNQERSENKGFTNPARINAPLKKPAPIFTEEDSSANDQHSSGECDLAKDIAAKVAEGVKTETITQVQHADDAKPESLFEPINPVAKHYQKELQLKKDALKKSESESNEINRKWDIQSNITDSANSGTLLTNPSTSSTSSSSSAQLDPTSEFEKAKALIRAKAAKMLGSANAQQATSEEEIRKQKEIAEQKMMNEIYRKVIEDQAAAMASSAKKRKKTKKPNYEYDSDEDTEGGTWEHKKRMQEMEKTKQWAMDLTDEARGKHHLSDFLPAEELEKFMEKVQAVREGRDADFSDYSKYRIQADNLGYKMLQKAGWEEGKGLGSNGEGIQQPINKGKISFDQSGVGAQKVSEIKKDDDDFDLYRKRMMLAYKFRPNPLNNPRRAYYE